MKTTIKLFGILIAGTVFFFGGFFLRDAQAGIPPQASALEQLIKPSDRNLTPTEAFQTHFSKIEANYYRTVPTDKLRNAAMIGLVSSLGDPHTNYLEPKIAEQFSTETRGDFVGVGARLQEDPLGTKVFSVFPNGPARDSGVQPGDVITAVDGESVAGLTTDAIVTKIRGEEGTKVNLTIVRESAPKPFDLLITRRKVEIPTVEHRKVSGDIGYIQVTNFASTTPVRFQQALQELNNESITGLVVDMRSNPGGLLSAAVDMLSLFVANKPVVTMRGRNGKVQSASTKPEQTVAMPYPVVVLINEESASAAEIFTGVLRDYRKATTVGEHTYGKASVQDLYALPEGASAKVTIAKYFLPSGEDIGRKTDEDGTYISGGIKPDIEVPFEFKEGTQFGIPGKDTQLDKAIDVLKSKR